MNFDLHAVLDAAEKLVEKAAEIGVAAHVAIKAFHDRLYPAPHDGPVAASDEGVYGSCPANMQAAIDDAVESCQPE